MDRLIECVPNFSEGREQWKIDSIVSAIKGDLSDIESSDIKILNIDSGYDANRTVVTFVGTPDSVVEAAFRGVREAARLIDMRAHSGKHPRSGATDVLPIVPISGISIDECAVLARNLASRIYSELGIPCYCYEAAAFRPEHKKLEDCRKGEYESLPQKLVDPKLRPDFGPDHYNETIARSGAVNVGARNFLIAVNFNLQTPSAEIAGEIAKDVRESGRLVSLSDGCKARQAGSLKGCKAIGWYIKEYGFAQVSMNITNIEVTPLHVAFQEVCKAAEKRGTHVTGTEIIGLVPRKCLIDAGKFFCLSSNDDCSTITNNCYTKKDDSFFISESVRILNLNEISPFDPAVRTI